MPNKKHQKTSTKKQQLALQDLSNIFASSVITCSQKECKELFKRIENFNNHLEQKIEGVASFHMETSTMSLCNSEGDSGIVFDEAESYFTTSPKVNSKQETKK